MYQSRLSRYQEKKFTLRIFLALGGMVAILLAIWFFGFKLLVGLSIASEFLKGSTKPTPKIQNQFMPPPVLDDLPEATNSAEITISGNASPKLTLILYQNDVEIKKLTIPDDGTFKIPKIQVKEGENNFSAVTVDDNGNKSEYSNIVKALISHKNPNLEVTNPASDSIINGDNNKYQITGKTDDGNTLTINGRIVVVGPGGTFNYPYNLSDGENRITIISSDQAGNQSKIERVITYKK
jgi:hypothetical protein